MAETSTGPRTEWSSGLAFVLAASGSAVGLGNLWRFPYLVGENGGAAFVLIYLVCIALVGFPIMLAEIVVGRRGRGSPVRSLGVVALAEGAHRGWVLLGWLGMLAGFLILSFYSVVGGWSLYYVYQAVLGAFQDINADAAGTLFDELRQSPDRLIVWHTLFMVALFSIVAAGVRKGVQRAVTLLMPLLLLILVGLVGYGVFASGVFLKTLAFLFAPDFAAMDEGTVLAALGQAFFTLSLGMGAIMVYGAYLPARSSIGRNAGWIVSLDTATALLAGLAIFPIVFAAGMEPGEGGPGLVFVTLPIVFGEIPLGAALAVLFFVLLAVAAVTSGISLLEPATAYLAERRLGRISAAALVSGVVWLLGIVCALSLNVWSHVQVLPGMGVFDAVSFVANDIMLPLGGLLVALFVGWCVRPEMLAAELGSARAAALFRAWLVLLRFLAPVAVFLVFLDTAVDIT